ncbi:SET domain-containing protein [Daldinia bambusicola]|nr:SET domain-containing protein [Daldinia bambusicola]
MADSTVPDTTIPSNPSPSGTGGDNTVPHTQSGGEEDPVFVAAAGHKGVGCFAARDIAAGERILLEPCTLAAIDYPDPYERMNDLMAAYLRLDVQDREDILYLHSDKDPRLRHRHRAAFDRYGPLTEEELEECVTVRLVHFANCFEVVPARRNSDGTERHARSGVFIKASRFNHSCDPNCWYSTTALEGHFVCITSRAIKEGEEFTISYIPNHGTRGSRHEALQKGWKFACGCSKCEGVDSEFDAELEKAYAAAFPNDPIPDQEPLPKSLGEIKADGRRLVQRVLLLEKLGWLKELFFACVDAAEFFHQFYQDILNTNVEDALENVQRSEYFFSNAISVGRQIWPEDDVVFANIRRHANGTRGTGENLRRHMSQQAESSTQQQT